MKRLLSLFLLLLFLAHPLAALEKVSVQLLWMDQFEFAGFYIAKEKGYYAQAGLDVEIKPFRHGLQIPQDVALGKTTYGVGYSSILIDRGNGLPLVALGALFQSSPLAVAVKASSGIKTINDLKNKKVMVTQDHKNDASIMAMLTSRGLKKSDFILLPHSFDDNDLIHDTTDAMLVYTTNEPYTLHEKGVETTILHPKDYGFDFYGDLLYTSESEIIHHPKRTKAFYEATMKGWRYAFEHTDESVELILKRYNSQGKTKTALTYEADTLKSMSGWGTNEFGKLNARKLEAIDNVYHLMGMMRGNIDMSTFIWESAQAGEKNIAFSEEERTYLRGKKKITMCVDPDWMPFEAIRDDRHTGLAADYMNLYSKAIGVPVVLVPTKNWTESLTFARQRRCDIVSMAMETSERAKYLNFTQPYLTSPIVFATRMDQSFVSDFTEITSRKLGITRADGAIERLKKEYPGINLVEVESIHEGLKMVSRGELFALIDTLTALSYAISEDFSGQLKIAGKLDQTRELRVGVRNDDSILLNLFEKAIGTVSAEEKQRIETKWIAVKYEKGADYVLIAKISSVLVTVVLVLLWWNRKLHRLNRKIERLSVIDELSGLYNRRYFNTKFMQIRSQVIQQRHYFFFILLDIDNFKKYNDAYGHLKGDDVIAAVGETLRHIFNRHTDIAFRLGGEEFGCFGSSNTIQGASAIAEEIRYQIEALAIEHQGNSPYGFVTVSGGIVILSSDSPEESQESIYHRADTALYEAKEAGRNRIVAAL